MKDVELTKLKQETREFEDYRSFVDTWGKEWLYGPDIAKRRLEIWERDNRRCVLCGVYCTFEQFEWDHILPKSKGGDDSLANGRVLCGPFQNGCHRGSKGAKHA